jgi:hypothetical protein
MGWRVSETDLGADARRASGLSPEQPPGFLLQVGRVVVRGSELERLVEQAEPVGQDASGELPGDLAGWVQRSRVALEQRDDLVKNVWLAARRRQLSPADLSSDGSTTWTEERLSAITADMVELIVETSTLRKRL